MTSLGSIPVARLVCHVPPSGAWWADVALDSVALPALGATILTIGDLSLAGAVVRVAEEEPGLPRAVVRGGPGWWLPLVRGESWQSDGGVRLKTVLAALAKATGETLAQPSDVSLGTAYGYPMAGPWAPSTGAMALDDLMRREALPTWRVEPGGTTRFDAWPATGAADSKGSLERRQVVAGVRLVGIDASVKAFLPGATVEGVPIARAIFRESAGATRVEAWES